jgi:hypothetical protein
VGSEQSNDLFVWLVADGWCWFVLREKYYWLVADGWFVLREKYCWLVADKPNEQGVKQKSLWGERMDTAGLGGWELPACSSVLASRHPHPQRHPTPPLHRPVTRWRPSPTPPRASHCLGWPGAQLLSKPIYLRQYFYMVYT